MSTFSIRPARPDEQRAVLRLTLHSSPTTPGELEAQVTGFIQYARQMSLDLSRQWVAERAGLSIAACTCIGSPGRTAMLFLPSSEMPGLDGEALGCLVDHAVSQERDNDVRLFQCLLEPQDRALHALLVRHGFRNIAELHYLKRDLSAPVSLTQDGAGAARRDEWKSYEAAGHSEFARLIQDTYEGSLDCPGLSGLRQIEDVIAGYRAAGRFFPHRWRMLRRDGRPAGCILLGENPLRPVLEVVYMGVHPAFRRQGIGSRLLLDAVSLAHREGMTELTLAVDSANLPARTLYSAFGFVHIMSRAALIRPIKPTSGQP